MYQLSIPFMLEQIDTYGTEMFINKLKELKANIVFLALDCYQMDREKQEKVFASLRKNVPIFQQAGFKVGVWVWTFMIRENNSFTHITGMSGKRSSAQVCPSDPDFCAFAYEYMQNIAKSNPDMIMFDDDYRYGNPDCYMLCKENEDGKAVWIGNFFADECMNTTVVLDRAYQEIAFINCSGKLNGNKVELDFVAPFASVGFEVK